VEQTRKPVIQKLGTGFLACSKKINLLVEQARKPVIENSQACYLIFKLVPRLCLGIHISEALPRHRIKEAEPPDLRY
jgi:hypothetical protein